MKKDCLQKDKVYFWICLSVGAIHLGCILSMCIFATPLALTPSSQRKFVVETVVLNDDVSCIKQAASQPVAPSKVLASSSPSNISLQDIKTKPIVSPKPTPKVSSKVISKLNPKVNSNPNPKQSVSKPAASPTPSGTPSTPSAAASRLLAARQSLAQVSLKKEGEAPLKELGTVEGLKLQAVLSDRGAKSDENAAYYQAVSFSLRQALRLPEMGEVKVELTIDRLGKILKVRTIESKSSVNQAYLENRLLKVAFPPFGSSFKQENQHTFTLIFTHDT